MKTGDIELEEDIYIYEMYGININKYDKIQQVYDKNELIILINMME